MITKANYLNTASDLRRAANWVGRNQVEKIDLIAKLIDSAQKDPRVRKVLEHFGALKDPNKAFKDSRSRIFFAEQLLVSSSRLQNWKPACISYAESIAGREVAP